MPFAIILGGDELKEGLVTVKEQKWEFVEGKKEKIQSNEQGAKIKRAELVEWHNFGAGSASGLPVGP